MSVRYDPLLVRALAAEITAGWGGAQVRTLVMDRSRRAASLKFPDRPDLVALLHPEFGYLLAGAPEGADVGGQEGGDARTVQFRRLILGEVMTPADERLLELSLVDSGGRERQRIVLELHTNQWNLLLLEPLASAPGEYRISRTLWKRELRDRTLAAGKIYRRPGGARRGAEAPALLDEWLGALGNIPAEDRRRTALETFAFVSALNVDYVLGSAASEEVGAADQLQRAHQRYRELRAAAGAWLLERRWGLQPYVASLNETASRKHGSLLEAMAEAAHAAGVSLRQLGQESDGSGSEPTGEAVELHKALVARRKRLTRRRGSLEREIAELGDPEDLRAIGSLLLTRIREVPRGMALVELADFDGTPKEVELDPALDAASNANAYFEEAARRERALRRVPAEIASVDRALARIESALETLASASPTDEMWAVVGGKPEQRREGQPGPERLPYLKLRSSGGLEIRVGRSARTNDDLTFRHSAPDDIWMHARQVQGAHVILRWGDRETNPPKRDLQEAAVVAAVHSGGRHSGTVAVDWTRRKYVRKPRKSPPGTVVPDRVKTLFVEPSESLVKRLRSRAEGDG
jgi:hypothetical protein